MGVSLVVSVFFSLLTGACLSILITKWLKVKIEYILSLCAGVLCGVLFLELIPHSFSDNKVVPVFLGIVIGLPLMFIIDKLMHNHSHNGVMDKTASFYFLILAITLHNVPSGLALGNHVDHEGHLFHLVVFHHIPEGMTLMMIYFASCLKIHHLLASFAFLSLSLNGFALLGSMVPISSGHFLGMLLGVAISTIGYVAIFELFFPSLKKGFGSYHWLSLLTGIFIAGIILIIG
ncbi:MAG: ZIP family metal transporter [Bacillota bacterium]